MMIMKDEKTTDNQLENLTVLVYSRLFIEHHEYVNSNSQCVPNCFNKTITLLVRTRSHWTFKKSDTSKFSHLSHKLTLYEPVNSRNNIWDLRERCVFQVNGISHRNIRPRNPFHWSIQPVECIRFHHEGSDL